MNGSWKWKALMVMAAVIAMAISGGGGGAVPEMMGRDSLRTRTDALHGRTWVLGLDNVRVYDTAKKTLIRQIGLPSWSVVAFICMPDIALDRRGSAFISSNVQSKLWRVDADSFEVKQFEISLLERERWDIGFGALAFAADGTLFAMTSSANSLWKIDIAMGRASLVELYPPPVKACALTGKGAGRIERSGQR